MEYFKITKASDRVYRITDPFGAICTLITGSKMALLADTGIGFGNIADAVKTVTGLPVTAVNTHEHLDHSMGGRFFDKVYMDKRCREYLPVRNGSEFRKRVLDIYMPRGPVPGFSAEDYYAYDYSNICWTEGTEIFELGDIKAQLIPIPSHTPGSVGILLHELELLLTGDSIAPLTSLMLEESLSPEEHAEVLKGLKVHTHLSGYGRQYSRTTNWATNEVTEHELPGRVIANLGVNYSFKNFGVGLNCYNLLNTQYEQGGVSTGFIRQQGRWLLADISYKF